MNLIIVIIFHSLLYFIKIGTLIKREKDCDMKKYFLFVVCIVFIFLTGFFSSCDKKKMICNKCLDKDSHAKHSGLCRIILSKQEINRTDEESDQYENEVDALSKDDKNINKQNDSSDDIKQ